MPVYQEDERVFGPLLEDEPVGILGKGSVRSCGEPLTSSISKSASSFGSWPSYKCVPEGVKSSEVVVIAHLSH